MLLRRYIGRRLSDYYNQPSHRVVGSTSTTGFNNDDDDDDGIINFRSLWGGEYHWKRLFQRLYKEQHGQWLTPVELFRPHYSHVITNWIVQQQQQMKQITTDKSGIEIVEIGGGRGTNAKYILSKLQEDHPELYERISSYKIFDSSETLHELQHKVLKENKNGYDGGKVELVLEDMLHVAEGSKQLLSPSRVKQTFVIACELLDNLPHDKIYRDPKTRLIQQAEIVGDIQNKHMQNNDMGNHLSSLKETFQPLNDKLLSSILKDVPSYIRSDFQPTWIPSVACGLIRNLYKDRPSAHLLLADFDYLPPPDLPLDQTNNDNDDNDHLRRRRTTVEAENEPLITDMNDLDYECYLNSPRYCDILYPTNFYKLALFVQKQTQKVKRSSSQNAAALEVTVMKQAEFLATYGPEEVKGTKSWITGYSPLVHDFSNCSVMMVHPRFI